MQNLRQKLSSGMVLLCTFTSFHPIFSEPEIIDPKEGEKDATFLYWKSEYRELAEKKRAITEKYNQLLKKQASRAFLAEDISSENQDLLKKIKEYEDRTTALLQQIEKDKESSDSLSKEVSSLRTNLDSINSDYSKLKETSQKELDLSSKLAALEKEYAALKILKDVAEKKAAEVASLEARIKQLESEKLALQKSMEAAAGQKERIAELEGNIATLQGEKDKLQKSFNEQGKTSLMLSQNLARKTPDEYVAQLEKTLKDLEKDRANTTKNLEELKAETIRISNLKSVDLGLEIQSKEGALANKEAELKKIQEEEDRLEKEWSSYRNALQESRTQLQKNKERLEELEKQNSLLSNEIEVYKKKNEEINRELGEIRKDYDAALSDLASAQERYNEEKEKYLEEVEKLNSEKTKLEDTLEAQVKRGNVSISRRGDKLVINLKNSITFRKGSAELLPEGKKILNSVYAALKKYTENKIYIEGNTDNTPIHTKKFPNNWHLSFGRAFSVFEYLRTTKGANPKKFGIAGMGEFNPLNPNTTEKNKLNNRRVEIIVTPFKILKEKSSVE